MYVDGTGEDFHSKTPYPFETFLEKFKLLSCEMLAYKNFLTC